MNALKVTATVVAVSASAIGLFLGLITDAAKVTNRKEQR